ncbi:S-adenosyl-L-methionine-dependent tRNA 4-demethylwyosine synthase TYW1 [Labeo rohita]|uniref:S-adenosyl-L-methionine-dependent tRNA 4-demethylwyosine synthase TYW1 n=1 Tax=Labeo rohita TaxID=84645 RepID=A0ABQ8LZW6_LABRO|nr:S-adenosyl-L-methionine-dependent tRNA 4-demethylwyosine synthase TYW1 [Labeo rohita]
MFLAVLLSCLLYSAVGAEMSVCKLYSLAFTGALSFTESYLLTVWQNRLYVYTTAAVLIGVWFTVNMLFKKCTSKMICVFLVATYTDGQPTESAEWFCKWLEEASTDFRYGKTYLKGMRYAVFGLGNSVYVGHYNTVSKNIDKWLWMLSAARIMTRGEGDCNVVKSRHGSVQADFQAWKTKFLNRLQALAKGEKKACSGKCKNGSCKNKKKHKEEAEDSHSLAEKNNSEASQPSSLMSLNTCSHGNGSRAAHPESRLFPCSLCCTHEELMESSSDAESSAEEEKSHGSVIDMEDLGNAMFSLLSISKVEIEITAHGQALSLGHIGPCGTGSSRSGLSSFWLAVSLSVSSVQAELCRATACITAVTCMGGLWEMERFQLKRAALVLSV